MRGDSEDVLVEMWVEVEEGAEVGGEGAGEQAGAFGEHGEQDGERGAGGARVTQQPGEARRGEEGRAA